MYVLNVLLLATPVAHTPKPSAMYHTTVANVPDVSRTRRDVERRPEVELSDLRDQTIAVGHRSKPGARADRW